MAHGQGYTPHVMVNTSWNLRSKVCYVTFVEGVYDVLSVSASHRAVDAAGLHSIAERGVRKQQERKQKGE